MDRELGRLSLALVCALVLAATNTMAADHKSHARKRSAPAPSPAVKLAEATVKASMKDPDSAKFEGVNVLPNGVVCGMVNGKNSYGGYSGYQMFGVAADGTVYIATDRPPGDTAEWRAATKKLLVLCGTLPAD